MAVSSAQHDEQLLIQPGHDDAPLFLHACKASACDGPCQA